MKSLIVGRKEQQAVLDELYNSDEAHLLAVYGRRRVGKTFLIREYFENELTFYHTALSPKELEEQPDLLYRAQLSEFGKTLSRYGANFAKLSSVGGWPMTTYLPSGNCFDF